MSAPVSASAITTTSPGADTLGKRKSATGAEQERRIAWGKQAGAKVAAAYREMQGSVAN